ncbi:hypothetical protein COO16_04180 [Bacillus pseudomycoides]|uniref:hypothetical protein n=1 Tax=Bacillus pseudomycoides TaxID=64104 RepID=UPI000BECA3FC|nr:hypothetical protein [Bacillus pseudomycoides]PDY14166.1 hypothetical protein COO16_04180 [Bacillus pseudomycoides]
MKTIPYELKQKLRQYDKFASKMKKIEGEIHGILDRYKVPYDNLTAQSNIYSDEPRTESLTHISYGEGDVEENIKEIEEVFLYFANKYK